MTGEAIYRALCSIDPALKPWQKCGHEPMQYAAVHGTSGGKFRCAKCGYDMLYDVIPFGDGKPRYAAVDALLALCERLALSCGDARSAVKVYLESRHAWSIGGGATKPMWLVTLWRGGNSAVEVSEDALIAALSEAILRVMGKWAEVGK